MKYINNKKDWSNLISILTENRNHFSLASDGIKSGVDAFCEMLDTEYIVHASTNASGVVWQSRPLISCFCETFDPILDGIFSENSQTRHLLDKHQRLLPLANTLTKKEDCRNVADKIKNAILNLEDLLPIEAIDAVEHAHPNNWDEIIEAAESLELVAGCLYAIYDELISQESRWCNICFRKSSSNSIYCDSHKASKSNALQDTQHRKGLRVRERIPADIHKKWILHRSKRSTLGDDFLLFALTTDVPDQILSDTSGVVVEKPMKDFVEATQSQNWSQVCDYWNFVLQKLPTVNNIIIKQANEFDSWNDFRSAILFSLKNKHETTQHPYWIFMMLIEAEDWLSIEKQFSDMRLTDTEDKTIALALLGKSNTEIAKELNISRVYVWRIKKLNDIP
jgi:hypothetical protein